MTPLFSVIIPVFNAGKYLDATIASVLAQTFAEFELIVVDDGSTDGAADRARSIKDPRLSVIAQPNAGAPAALNRGLSAARGEYIALLDSDDLWAPEKLQRHKDYFAAHPEADVTFSGLKYIGAEDEPIGLPERKSAGSFTFEQLFIDNVLGSSSVIAARKQAVIASGGFDPTFCYLYDIDFLLRIARLRNSNIVAIPEPLAYYRRHPRQQTSDWHIISAYWTKVLEKFKLLEPAKIGRLERAAQTNMDRYLSYLAFEQGDPSTAIFLLGRAWQMNPLGFSTDLRNWKLLVACCAALVLPVAVFRQLASNVGLRQIAQRPQVS